MAAKKSRGREKACSEAVHVHVQVCGSKGGSPFRKRPARRVSPHACRARLWPSGLLLYRERLEGAVLEHPFAQIEIVHGHLRTRTSTNTS